MITLYNEDCLPAMEKMQDNQFDLAIVDPPYGEGNHYNFRYTENEKKEVYNNIRPSKKYFKELFRVSKNQIIWGGNYFIDNLKSSRCFIVWDKKISEDFSLAMCELAWTSYDKLAKIYRLSVPKVGGKIHPTQKPVKLYEWLLINYAKEGDKILDTHLGSGSIAIACHNLGYELTACELDTEYYNNAIKRLKQHQAQQRLFV